MSDVEEVDGEVENLRFHDRPSEIVELSMPVDVVARLRELAAARDTSLEALLRFYIGQGMRPMSAGVRDRSLETTAFVLRQFIASDEQRAEILRALGPPVSTTSG